MDKTETETEMAIKAVADLNKEPLYCLFEVGAKVKLRPGSEPWVFHRALRKKVLTIKSIRLLSNVGLKDSNEGVVYQTYIELCNGKTFRRSIFTQV